MSLRRRIREALENERLDEVEQIVADEPGSLRHLIGLTYAADEELRGAAARGIARASRHHPRLVQDLVRRLVWAMNDESGTNAVTAPAVVQAIADEQPDLLLPMVPDLIRLAADSSLYDGLAAALHTVASECPGKVGDELQATLNRNIRKGTRNGI